MTPNKHIIYQEHFLFNSTYFFFSLNFSAGVNSLLDFIFPFIIFFNGVLLIFFPYLKFIFKTIIPPISLNIHI